MWAEYVRDAEFETLTLSRLLRARAERLSFDAA